jgi:hypothetical protein
MAEGNRKRAANPAAAPDKSLAGSKVEEVKDLSGNKKSKTTPSRKPGFDLFCDRVKQMDNYQNALESEIIDAIRFLRTHNAITFNVPKDKLQTIFEEDETLKHSSYFLP